MKYRIYIDEVGNPDLESSDNPNHRFLSLTGVILELNYVQSVVYPQMEELKQQFFRSHPDEPIIFHRKELVNAKHPFEALRDPVIKEQFDSKLLQLLEPWEYTVITVCIDKQRHREAYTTWRYDPYHYCLEVLLERFYFFLRRIDAKGDVMAESRGGKENQRLMNSFERLWNTGSHFLTAEDFQLILTSKQLKVKQKHNNISGLQLADLIAHPSRNEVLRAQGLLEREIAPFGKKVIKVLQNKYDKKGKMIFGKKFL
jgi:hypothetical protein